MKFLMVLACVALAAAAPQRRAPERFETGNEIYLVKETQNDNIGTGGYNFAYELSDGQSRQESAELVNAGSEDAFLVIRGSYTVVDPATGRVYTITYIADQNGYRAEGDLIPQ